MATRYCQRQIQWIAMNSLYLRVAAALIIAVGIAGLIGGTVLCRGNTIEIINGDSVQGIYPHFSDVPNWYCEDLGYFGNENSSLPNIQMYIFI
ncbi:unnamed protein product [Taenia asiatica]|uniref:TMhelix containing protein n=1 Tax=Taenia asiatica TaxID=60517 RepID=A0A0R3WA39_TAEAS|nr:unnamed protein product [Taenia asiatica]